MNVSNIFLPNQPSSKQTQQFIILFWVFLVGLTWVLSPFVFLPKPVEVWQALKDLCVYYNLRNEVFTSFKLNLETILVSIPISLGLAYLHTINFFKPLVSVFGRLRFLSLVGLSFFFTVMTTTGHQLKLSILVFSVSVFFVTGMVDVINGIPQEQYDLAKTLHMNEWQSLWEVVVLGQIDKAFEVLRQNAAIGFMMLTMVEGMSRSEGGIGDLLLTQQKHFHMAAIFAIQFVVLAVGLGQDYSIGFLRNFFCEYADLTRSRK